MAITATTNMANRYGLNTSVYAFDDKEMATPLMTIDFVNVTDIDISGDRVWATGGQAHANKIGFNDPVEGTFKLSTQILTMELLNLMSGGTAGDKATTVVFKNTSHSKPVYYILKSETVWQDESGNVYNETLTFHKISPKRALNISYSGEGDPTSVDIEFDVMQDESGNVLTVDRADSTAEA